MDRKALFRMSYGVYIVSSKRGGDLNGQIANAVVQITAEPPKVLVGINKANLTHEFIAESGVFAISVLAESTPMEFIGKFGFRSGREVNKFEGVNYKLGVSGAPVVLDNAVAYVDCKLSSSHDAGTHTIFVGEVVDAQLLSNEPPMTYAYYHQIKGGRSPKNAPTYAAPQKNEGAKGQKYICTVCGYVYDPAEGDPSSGADPGTPFDKLPSGWVCPICGASKSAFEPVR